jgi:predicted nucleic acid-binding protein
MITVDTDVMVDLLRGYPPAVVWLASLGAEEFVVPGFVAMELVQGCRTKAEQVRVERLFLGRRVVWPSPVTCDAAFAVFRSFHLCHRVGIIDVLIGQLAVVLDAPLHTFNRKHYELIPGLTTVQPYAKGIA